MVGMIDLTKWKYVRTPFKKFTSSLVITTLCKLRDRHLESIDSAMELIDETKESFKKDFMALGRS